MSNTFPASALSRVTSLLEEVGAEKAAAAKQGSDGTELGHSGSAKSDPGGYKGPSTHPSAKADGNVQAAPLGERFRENSADMKDKHTVANVDQISGEGGSQDSKQYNIGTQQSATGEDPKVEDNYKSDKEDPGTSHPANADEQGKKYASMGTKALTKLAYDKMNEVLADMANGYHNKRTAVAAPASQTPAQKKAADDAGIAAKAGYDLAGAVASQQPDLEKMAAFQEAAEGFIKQALEDADEVAVFLRNYSAERNRLSKQAEGPMPPEAMGGGPPPEMAGGGPDMGGMGGMGGMAGGGPDPGGMPPEMGGPGAPAPGPAPGGDMGGGGGPGGAGGHEQALMELANALMEAGIGPDELIQAMQGGGMGGAGGGPGGGGGGPPEGMGGGGGGEGGPEGAGEAEAEPEPEGGEKSGAAGLTRAQRQQIIKMASSIKDLQRKGKIRIKEAKPGTKLRTDRDEMKNFLNEVCRR